MQNTSNEDFGALLPSKNGGGGWRRVSAASNNIAPSSHTVGSSSFSTFPDPSTDCITRHHLAVYWASYLQKCTYVGFFGPIFVLIFWLSIASERTTNNNSGISLVENGGGVPWLFGEFFTLLNLGPFIVMFHLAWKKNNQILWHLYYIMLYLPDIRGRVQIILVRWQKHKTKGFYRDNRPVRRLIVRRLVYIFKSPPPGTVWLLMWFGVLLFAVHDAFFLSAFFCLSRWLDTVCSMYSFWARL
jgi:hypothetical protein